MNLRGTICTLSALSLAACTVTEPPARDPIAGKYVLESLDGQPIPMVPTPMPGAVVQDTLVGDTLIVTVDRTFAEKAVFSSIGVRNLTIHLGGYVVVEPDGSYNFAISPELSVYRHGWPCDQSLTMTSGGRFYRFRALR